MFLRNIWLPPLLIITTLLTTTTAERDNSNLEQRNNNNDNYQLFHSYSSYAPDDHPVKNRAGTRTSNGDNNNNRQQLIRCLFKICDIDEWIPSETLVKTSMAKDESLQTEVLRSYENYSHKESKISTEQKQQQKQRFPRNVNFTSNSTNRLVGRQQHHHSSVDPFKQHEINNQNNYNHQQPSLAIRPAATIGFNQTRQYNRTYAAVATAGGGRQVGRRYVRNLNYTRNSTIITGRQPYHSVNQFKQHEINQNQQQLKPPQLAVKPVATTGFNQTRQYNRTYAAVAASGGGRQVGGRYVRSLNYTRNSTIPGRQIYHSVNQFKQHEINQNHQQLKPPQLAIRPAAASGFNQTRQYNRTYAAVAASGGGRQVGGRYARSLNYTRNGTLASKLQNHSVNQFKQHEINQNQQYHQKPPILSLGAGKNNTNTNLRNSTSRLQQNHTVSGRPAKFNRTQNRIYTLSSNKTLNATQQQLNLNRNQNTSSTPRMRQNGMFLNRLAVPSTNFRGQLPNFTNTHNVSKEFLKSLNATMKNQTIITQNRSYNNVTNIRIPYTSRWRLNKRSIPNVFLNYLMDGKIFEKQPSINDSVSKSLVVQPKTNDVVKVQGEKGNLMDNIQVDHGEFNRNSKDKLEILNQVDESRVDGTTTTTIAPTIKNQEKTQSPTTKLLEKLSTPLMFGHINVRRVISREQLVDETLKNNGKSTKEPEIAADTPDKEEPVDDTVLIQVPPRRIRCRPNQRVALGRCRTIWSTKLNEDAE